MLACWLIIDGKKGRGQACHLQDTYHTERQHCRPPHCPLPHLRGLLLAIQVGAHLLGLRALLRLQSRQGLLVPPPLPLKRRLGRRQRALKLRTLRGGRYRYAVA